MYVHLLGKGTYKTRMSKKFKDESFIDDDGVIVYWYGGSPADIRKVAKVFEKYYGKHNYEPTTHSTNFAFASAAWMGCYFIDDFCRRYL